MENLRLALAAWRDILGSEYVIADEASLKAVQTATFATTVRSSDYSTERSHSSSTMPKNCQSIPNPNLPH